MSPHVRKVKTASGATAVQIVEKRGGVRRILAHLGSAHDELELAVLMAAARERLQAGQLALDLGVDTGPEPGQVDAVVTGTASQVLWDVLGTAYQQMGFETLGDEAFRALVLARIVEPTSKAGVADLLAELGMPTPHENTLYAALRRAAQRDYRDRLARACWEHSVRAAGGVAALVLYDVSTLHFEIDAEDELRRVGMSKERRVDPQIQIGLLVDPGGFPLEVHCFQGNTAETRTLIPVLRAFQDRHGIRDLVVVADAGMLSAGNLNALEDAGFGFIVGSRLAKAPYDLADHFQQRGDFFADGQIVESARVMGIGGAARSRRIVYQYRFERRKRDDRAINAMVEKAEKVANGTRPLKRDRFVAVRGADKTVDWARVDRARQLSGLKGYVTNIPTTTMTGAAVISAYHDLWQVEKSFRMAKSDLRARPIFHRTRDSIEAHLTVVFAALAVSRHLQAQTGVSIKKLVRTLRPLRTVQIRLAGQTITATPMISPEARAILDQLPPITAPGAGH